MIATERVQAERGVGKIQRLRSADGVVRACFFFSSLAACIVRLRVLKGYGICGHVLEASMYWMG